MEKMVRWSVCLSLIIIYVFIFSPAGEQLSCFPSAALHPADVVGAGTESHRYLAGP